MSVQTELKAQGWYLEHRDQGHFKFYTVISVADGTVVTHWGRIGSAGQAKIEKHSPSGGNSVALRQVHSKIAKGYEFKHEDIAFFLDERDVAGALGEGRERPDPKRLTMLFDRALRDPKFTGDKESVLVGYDAFLAKAQTLMDRSATQSFESVMNDFDELKVAWSEIDDKHSLAATTIEMTNQMLMKALVSGSLE